MERPLICIFLLLVTMHDAVSQGASWSYSGPTGPANWGNLAGAAACHGRSQSPININTYETGQKSFPPFVLTGYNLPPVARGTAQPRPTSMVNNGHVLQGNLDGDFLLKGGGLVGTYKAVQFQLHWGSVNSRGSEHTKNGQAYPAELHIIHYDSITYRTVGQAAIKPKGLANLGFWIRIGPKNLAWDPMINNLRSIKYANHPFIFTKGFAISSLIPADLTKFYRYSGSLTTPGCEESVIWTMFDKEIVLSRAQLAKLRQLSTFETPPYGPGAGPELHQRLIDNFRPIQRLWFRTVYQSWPHTDYSYYGGSNAGAAVPGWTPKFPVIATGGAGRGAAAGGPGAAPAGGGKKQTPASIPKKPKPAFLQAVGIAPAEMELGGYGAYDGYGVGMEKLWQALRNGQFGGEQDFEYYGDHYGNNNIVYQESDYPEVEEVDDEESEANDEENAPAGFRHKHVVFG